MSSPSHPTWHDRSIDDTLEAQGVRRDAGLPTSVATQRLSELGPNQLETAAGPNILQRLLSQFNDITVIALLIAALIATILANLEPATTSFLARYGDAIAILAIVILNAVIGLVQELRAASALRSLMEMTAPEATALRDGERVRIAAAHLVAGDVVLLDEGDRVPADLRLIESHQLTLTEAALTGESAPLRKDTLEPLPTDTDLADRVNMAFMGTHVSSGRGRGVVVATGMHTELGDIAGMLNAVEIPETTLQKQLQRFGTIMVIGCAVIAAIVFVIGLIRLDESIAVLFLTAVSLAVAAIPEGLPAITTIVLALGVQRMARRHALIRRLASVETLGAAQVICTDKTGTLTQNRMVVRRVSVGDHILAVEGSFFEPQPSISLRPLQGDPLGDAAREALIAAAAFAPAATLTHQADGSAHVTGDPTDGALLLLHDTLRTDATPRYTRVEEFPFDTERKMATCIARDDDGATVTFTHGAPEAVIERATSYLDARGQSQPLTDTHRRRLDEELESQAADGLRLLGLASRRLDDKTDHDMDDIERELTLIGLVGISDPPREEVAVAIQRAHAAGVRTVMITGDHPRTGAAIAREIGLIDANIDTTRAVLTGRALRELDDEALSKVAPDVRVVARATAADKLRFVEALRRRGDVVAMTGDGVNDAPALKAASIGVAMGQAGTDVAREAADVVLADDNYATIVAAIEEGRNIYSNIKKFIIFLLSINVGLVVAVFIGALLGWPALLTPTQILWINLVTNGLPALALGMEPVNLDPMTQPPRRSDEPLLLRSEVRWLVSYGLGMAVLGLGIFGYFMTQGAASSERVLTLARTFTFTVLALAPLFHAFNCRALNRSAFALGVLSNRQLLWAFWAAIGLQALAVYVDALSPLFKTVPLSAEHLAIAVALSLTVWVGGEAEKAIRHRLR